MCLPDRLKQINEIIWKDSFIKPINSIDISGSNYSTYLCPRNSIDINCNFGKSYLIKSKNSKPYFKY